MGNANYRQTTGNQYLSQDLRIYFQNDLPKFVLQSKIGNGKFMKTYIMRIDSTPVTVKVYLKLNDEDLMVPAANLTFIWKTLSPAKYPNLLPYQMWMKSSSRIKSPFTPIYLVRQYFHFNLYDRLSTRPFLNDLEKLWIVYQLFKCVEICHEHGIVHGDLKPENIMCTTANWIVLTDFSPFKPALIPDDDPTDFQYYFDSMGRHRCYLAPERFYRKAVGAPSLGTEAESQEPAANQTNFRSRFGSRRAASNKKMSNLPGAQSSVLTPAMDVFALGCLAAEVMLDGVPLLDLPAMLQYLSNSGGSDAGAEGPAVGGLGAVRKVQLSRLDQEESPARALLQRISNIHLRNVIADMTQKDPSARLSVGEYLDILQGKVPGLAAVETGSVEQPLPAAPAQMTAAAASSIPPAAPERTLSALSAPPLPPLCVFPAYFDSCLYPLFLKIHWNGVTPDERVNIICQSYGDIVRELGAEDDPAGASFFSSALGGISASLGHNRTVMLAADPTAVLKPAPAAGSGNDGVKQLPPFRKQSSGDGEAATGGASAFSAAKEQCSGAYLRSMLRGSTAPSGVGGSCEAPVLADMSSQSTDELLAQAAALVAELEAGAHGTVPSAVTASVSMAGLDVGRPRYSDEEIMRLGAAHSAGGGAGGVSELGRSRVVKDGAVVLIDLLHANFRHLRLPRSKVVCLLLFSRLGRHCADAVVIERILPLLLVSLEDQSAAVRAMGVRVLRCLLLQVHTFGASESNLFPLYLFPALTKVSKDHEPAVRVAFAESVASFAEVAKRFLDITHLTHLAKWDREGTVAGSGGENGADAAEVGEDGARVASGLVFPYDQRLDQLKEQVSRWIRDLIVELGPTTTGPAAGGSAAAESKRSSAVKRLLLTDITRLCVFFGQESAVDRVLTQLLTFLDDQDWELRYAFCAKIPAVCAFLGRTVTAECILPFLENAIYDVEERVVLAALHALTAILQSRLISNRFVVEFTDKCKCLLVHPSDTLRAAAVGFVAAAASILGAVDAAVFLLPLLRPVLRYEIDGCEITEQVLGPALVPNLSRPVYRRALLQKLAEINTLYQQQRAADGGVSSDDASMVAPEVSEDDAGQVFILQPYLREAARNVNTRALNARGAGVSGKSRGQLVEPPKDGVVTEASLVGLLDMTGLQLPEHCAQSILVPHQKYGSFLYRPLSDEVRRTTIMLDVDGQKSANKLRNLFGVTVRQGDFARAFSVGPDAAGLDDPGLAAAASSFAQAGNAQSDAYNVLRRIKALEVPPLPPDTGYLVQPTQDNRVYSSYTEPLDVSCSLDGVNRTAWRPKEGVLLTTLKEHGGAVNRLAVSPDQSFFASASSDRTVKIWQTRQLDRVAFPRSAASYDAHRGEVLDAATIENSHSVASVSSDGAVHVWRVDLQGGGGGGPGGASADLGHDEFVSSMSNLTVRDRSQVRLLDPAEGAVLCVNHFNSDLCSILTYATQRGGMHGWDLRAAKEVIRMPLRPELGYATSMTVSPDRNWICMGTSKGFVSLFDIRYNVPSKLWRHSSHGSIHRLACCKAPRMAVGTAGANVAVPPQSEGAFLFVAAGNNEAAVWGIPEGGECCKSFRSIPLDCSRGPVAPLPVLEEVALPRHPLAPIRFQDSGPPPRAAHEDSVRAILGRISQSNSSYLVTAGTDRSIRFWDFSGPTRCFTVSGLEAAQPKAIFDAPKLADGTSGKLFVCYVAATPSVDKILQMHLPVREGRGIVLPTVNAKDAILDLKNMDLPMRLMLSGSRDGEIKLWR